MSKKLSILFLSEVPLIKYGLLSGFSQQGYRTDFMYGEYSLYCDAAEQIKRLEKKINLFKPDIIFTEGYGCCAIQSISFLLKQHSIPLFFWAIEDPVTLGVASYYSPYADFIFTTTLECLDNYKNKPCGVLMFATNPEYHKNVGFNEKYNYDIAIAASNYSNRYHRTEKFIIPLVESNKYNIAFWGLFWDDFKRPVNLKEHINLYKGVLAYEELPALYSSCTIALGSQCDDTSFTQQSMRNFEVLGCGNSILLSYYTKAQESVFGDSGENIYLAKTTEEMLLMADEILSMTDNQRKELALKAQKFVYSNHNYRLRANQIIDAYKYQL
ncbi:MAG: glycosyltransferase [Syntrophothermus sp.]